TLRRAIDAMDRLHFAQLHEELRSTLTSPPLVNDYKFEAPDAFTFTIVGGAQRITIGRTQYTRDTPSAAWTKQTQPPGDLASGFSWPKGYYADFWAKPTA